MEQQRVKTFIKPGKRYKGKMPHSEVCMHMKVAGSELEFELSAHDMVQLYKGKHEFSGAILPGEAGLYWDADKGALYGYNLQVIK